MSDDRLQAARDAGQDDLTRWWILRLEVEVVPRLIAAKWTPIQEGLDGLGAFDHRHRGWRLIHSLARELDGEIWSHVSLSRRDRRMPTWEHVRDVGWLVHPDLAGVVVVAPKATHVNIGEVAHVWYCLTRPAVPDFTRGLGTI